MLWQVGCGRELWERSEPGDSKSNKRHLLHTEKLRKDKRRNDDSAK